MKQVSKRLSVGLTLLLVGLAGCREETATRIIASVDSDLRAGVDLDEVMVETFAEPGSPHVGRRTFALSAENPLPKDKFGLPFSFYTAKNTVDRFLMAVSGWKAGKKVVEQRQWVMYEAGKTRFLQLFLGGVCHGRICADAEQTCFPFTEDDVQAGTCGAVPEATLIADDPRGSDGTWGVDAAPFDLDAGVPPDANDGMDGADGADDNDGAPDTDSSMDGEEQCDPGYEPDGEAGCQDIDECEAADPCGRGECHNIDGSYRCGDCEPGYGPDEDDVCVDLDECERDTHTCDRDPETTCTNTQGGFECGACPAGFAGDAKRGEQGCVPVLDDLVVSWGKLEPAFDPLVTEYQVDVGAWFDAVEILPSTNAEHALRADGTIVSSGQSLRRTLKVGDNAMRLELSSGGASRRYVVAFARRAINESYVKAGAPTAQAEFGWSPALSDDGSTMAVGAAAEDEYAGAVYVVERTAGTWRQPERLVIPDRDAGDRFGASIALSGDGNILAVGANHKDSEVGAVYVFERSEGVWGKPVRLKPAMVNGSDAFGTSLSLSRDGRLLVVGMPGDADSAGLVQVFQRGADGWTDPAFFRGSGVEAGDRFGERVAISGDGNMLAIAALPGGSRAAEVYLTMRSSGSWLTPMPIETLDAVEKTPWFGSALALNGDGTTLAIGDLALQYIYVFSRNEKAWVQQAQLAPTNPGIRVFFGNSIALSRDGAVLAAGAYGENSFAGAIYMFTRTGAVWSEPQKSVASNAQLSSAFGISIGLSGNGRSLAVGAPYESNCARNLNDSPEEEVCPAAGAVYVYE